MIDYSAKIQILGLYTQNMISVLILGIVRDITIFHFLSLWHHVNNEQQYIAQNMSHRRYCLKVIKFQCTSFSGLGAVEERSSGGGGALCPSPRPDRLKEKNGLFTGYLHITPNNVMTLMPAGPVMRIERFASINTELHNRSLFSTLMQHFESRK